MHSVRGKQQQERSRCRKGRMDNSPNVRFSKPKSQLTGGNAPSLAGGSGENVVRFAIQKSKLASG